MRHLPIVVLGFLLLGAECQGEAGPEGPQGPTGPQGQLGSSCTVVDNGDGTKTISCDDGTLVVVADGQVGSQGDTGAQGVDGSQGAAGGQGLPGQSVVGASEPAGPNCAADGVAYTSATGTDYVCNGVDGASVTAAAEPPGLNCAQGGIAYTSAGGTDYVCDGADGAPGISVTAAVEPPGFNCPDGGMAYTTAAGTDYVCDGATGAPGPAGNLRMVVDATGAVLGELVDIDFAGAFNGRFTFLQNGRFWRVETGQAGGYDFDFLPLYFESTDCSGTAFTFARAPGFIFVNNSQVYDSIAPLSARVAQSQLEVAGTCTTTTTNITTSYDAVLVGAIPPDPARPLSIQ